MNELSFYDRIPRPWTNQRLTNLSIVGHGTETAVRIWVRTWQPGRFWLAVTETSLGTTAERDQLIAAVDTASQGTSNSLTTGPHILQRHDFKIKTDLTHVFEVTGLKRGTEYHYAVISDPSVNQKTRWETGGDGKCSFRTADTTSAECSFGLYSCHMPYPTNGGIKNMDMWARFGEELTESRSDFVIGCGDQVYTDGNKNVSIWAFIKKHKKELPKKKSERLAIMESWYRDIYRGYWGHVEMRNIFERFPNYMIWDDHEIMDGWGSYTKKELANQLDTIWEWEDSKKNLKLAYEMFEAAARVYIEYQHSHNPKTPPGQYDYSFRQGVCEFYVMDMRGNRDYNRGKKNYPILGKDQMDRILNWLNSPAVKKAPAVFIVSSVPVVHICEFVVDTFDLSFLGLADDLRDEWEHKNNRVERDILLDAVFSFSQTHQKKVVFLSGDVHIGAAFRLKSKKYIKGNVHQLTSSGITYCRAPGWGVLEAATKKAGDLASDNASKLGKVSFERLHVFNRNNFGIVRVNHTSQDTKIHWDLYGNTDCADELIRLKRITI